MRKRLKRWERMQLIDKFFTDAVLTDLLTDTIGPGNRTILVNWEKNLIVCRSAGGEIHYDLKKLLDILQYSSVVQ
jgi:hypothetical protein